MRFALSQEQRRFEASLDAFLTASGTAEANRAWARGEHEPGLRVWRGLAELGVSALLVPERFAGLGATAVDLVVAFERLGYHAVPGPWVDTAAVVPALLAGPGEGTGSEARSGSGDSGEGTLAGRVLPGTASGETLASVVSGPHVPYALDADVAGTRLWLDPDGTVRDFAAGRALSSMDGSRRLFVPAEGGSVGTGAVESAFEAGTLATAAQLLGAGQWLLDASVSYARQRRQYGKEIGQYQAIKHLLADVATHLELARPLVHGAAVAVDTGRPERAARDVSAAKVACAEAAHSAARTGLQVHGAIGYTAEHELSLRLTKVRALATAWGTPTVHRARVLRAVSNGAGAGGTVAS